MSPRSAAAAPPRRRSRSAVSPRRRASAGKTDDDLHGSGPPALVTAADIYAADPTHHWRADNAWIVSAYRVRHHSFSDAAWSFFTLHNDSLNVWSHALGSAIFLAALGVLWMEGPSALPFFPFAGEELPSPAAAQTLSPSSPTPAWPLALFIASAVLCMGVSSAYHLLHVINERTYSLLARLDYACIAVLTWGSFIALITYAFACAPPWVWAAHAALATISNGACVAVSLIQRFRTADWRLFRMSLFIATGAVGVLPFAHILATPHARQPTGEASLLLMGALYVGGALLYGFRVPERFAPGRFDLFLASHTIFHVAVVLACCATLNSLLAYYHLRNSAAGQCTAGSAW